MDIYVFYVRGLTRKGASLEAFNILLLQNVGSDFYIEWDTIYRKNNIFDSKVSKRAIK